MTYSQTRSGGNAINSAKHTMRPNKPGQVAKFSTSLPDEDPDQLYVVIAIKEDVERPSAYIRALNTGLSLPPINEVLLDDLEVVEVPTADLVGHVVTINKSDSSQVVGKVVKVTKEKITPDLKKEVNGVATNVWITIQDENGKENTGTLFVK